MKVSQRKIILILGIFLLVFAVSCQKREIKINEIGDQNELMKIIADKKTGYSNYVRAIQQLDANLTPSFWSSIANDKSYSDKKRQVAVVELFQRFVHPGITMKQFADVLNKPTWLKDNEVDFSPIGTGYYPLKKFGPGIVFFIYPFSNIRYDEGFWFIAIRIEGEISWHDFSKSIHHEETECKRDFLKAIRGEEVNLNMRNAKILDIGMITFEYKNNFWPPDLYDTSSYIQKKEGAK